MESFPTNLLPSLTDAAVSVPPEQATIGASPTEQFYVAHNRSVLALAVLLFFSLLTNDTIEFTNIISVEFLRWNPYRHRDITPQPWPNLTTITLPLGDLVVQLPPRSNLPTAYATDLSNIKSIARQLRQISEDVAIIGRQPTVNS